MDTTADLLVEVHVPLAPTPDLEPEDQFDWIETVLDFLEELEEAGDLSLYDDGESLDDVYVFSIHHASEEQLLAVARRVADLPGVPTGVFAVVTDTEAEEYGQGERHDIS